MLVVTVDDKMKFEKHKAKICPKVSQQIAVLKRMKKILPFKTRKCLLTTAQRHGISATKVPLLTSVLSLPKNKGPIPNYSTK